MDPAHLRDAALACGHDSPGEPFERFSVLRRSVRDRCHLGKPVELLAVGAFPVGVPSNEAVYPVHRAPLRVVAHGLELRVLSRSSRNDLSDGRRDADPHGIGNSPVQTTHGRGQYAGPR